MIQKKVAQKNGFLLIEVAIALVILLIGFSSVWQVVGYLITHSHKTIDNYDMLTENKAINQYDVNAIAQLVCSHLNSSDDYDE